MHILNFTFGNEAASTVDTGWVELDELQILQRKAGTSDHSVAITRASVCTCAAEVGTSITTSRQNGLVGTETVEGTILHVQSNDTDTLAILHDQVKGEVLDEEVRVVTEGLAVEGVEESVTGTVSGSGASVRLTTLAEFQRLAAEGALVYLALLGSRERNTEVLELMGIRRVNLRKIGAFVPQ